MTSEQLIAQTHMLLDNKPRLEVGSAEKWSKTLITIRPNLNAKGMITIHCGRLGRKLDSVSAISIKCFDTVIRPSGLRLARDHGDKTVHAGLIGELCDLYLPSQPQLQEIVYNPHNGDTFFHINGVKYSGGGVVTMIGWKAYLVA